MSITIGIDEIYKLVHTAYKTYKPYTWDYDNKLDREDFIQEAVLKVISKWDEYNEINEVSTFVFMWCRGAWTELQRKTYKHNVVEVEPIVIELYVEDDIRLEDDLSMVEVVERYKSNPYKLELLKTILGYQSEKELGSKLGISQQAVNKKIHKFKKELKSWL